MLKFALCFADSVSVRETNQPNKPTMFTVATLFVLLPALAITFGACKLAVAIKRGIVG